MILAFTAVWREHCKIRTGYGRLGVHRRSRRTTINVSVYKVCKVNVIVNKWVGLS